jgi:thiol-disulfide isomerase/thioredoxin
MQRWLAQNVSKKDDPTTGYYTFEARSLESAGKLAEAEGHKAEAVALYAKAIAAEPRYAEGGLAKRVRALWNEQGGTQEGWDIAIRRLPFPNAPQPVPAPLPIVAPPFDPWQKLYKPLPKATFTNSLGKPWSISNLRGKPAFVNVWATWCEPCRAELPQVQKLYEMSLQRGDFQVITFNVDDNPGVIEPFLKANGYTFPVIALTQAYVDGITQPPSNPQNWIVDQNATLRERSLGFDSTIADWAKAMAERVAPSSH